MILHLDRNAEKKVFHSISTFKILVLRFDKQTLLATIKTEVISFMKREITIHNIPGEAVFCLPVFLL